MTRYADIFILHCAKLHRTKCLAVSLNNHQVYLHVRVDGHGLMLLDQRHYQRVLPDLHVRADRHGLILLDQRHYQRVLSDLIT